MPTPENSSRSNPGAPGAHWYLVAVVLIIMGPIALGLSLWLGARTSSGGNQRFAAPGFTSVQVTAPGEYSIWRILPRGSTAPTPSSLRVTIVDPARGGAFELEPIEGAAERIGRRERVEVARTRLAHPGPYEVAVEGDFSPGEFAFGPSIGPGVAGGGLVSSGLVSGLGQGVRALSTLLFGTISLIGIVTGVVMFVVVRIARGRAGASISPRSIADQLQD